MNKSIWLVRILLLGAVLEIPIALGLLAAPSAMSRLLLQEPLSGAALVVARIAGGGLLALGISCWCARAAPASPAGLGVARALFVYNGIACVVLALGAPPLPGGALALGAAIIHGVLAVGLVATRTGRG
jgi:hypothetical protein